MLVTETEKYKLSLYETVEIIKESEEALVELVHDTYDNKNYIKITYHSDKRELFTKLMDVDSPFLPRIVEFFWGEDTLVIEEYIEGATLASLIERKEIDKRTVKNIFDDILSAIETLHEINIVHRDIKPANIIVTKNLKAVLIDFVIAKIYSPNLKQDSSLYGTIGYAPPEQYGFSQSDFRSDIYAIGITLKEITEVAYDWQIKRIIKKCTEFDPDKRPQSIKKIRNFMKRSKYIFISILIIVFLSVIGGYYRFMKYSKVVEPVYVTSD